MKKIIRILNLDIHSLNNAEYKNFMERFFKLIPLKAVSGEGDRPSELRLLGEEENMTSDFVGISDEDKATFNADMLLLTDVDNQSRTNDNTALLLNLDKRRDPLGSFIINTTSIGRKSSNPAYAPVSYTHLDVYKRQTSACRKAKTADGYSNGPPTADNGRLSPTSPPTRLASNWKSSLPEHAISVCVMQLTSRCKSTCTNLP